MEILPEHVALVLLVLIGIVMPLYVTYREITNPIDKIWQGFWIFTMLSCVGMSVFAIVLVFALNVFS